jgi:DNA-3-methyladenine glycosylase II
MVRRCREDDLHYRSDRVPVIIDSMDVIARGAGELAAADPVMREVLARTGLPPLRRSEPGFRGLARIVVAQQVSTASAAAITARLEAALERLEPQTVLAATEATLQGAGLSGPKIRTLRSAAQAASDIDFDGLSAGPAEDAHALLTAIPGIGPWTADMFLIVCLGHPDAFAAGDLALQEAARNALGLPGRPTSRALAAIAERWQPWRAVAARLLWSYYRVLKGQPLMPAGE